MYIYIYVYIYIYIYTYIIYIYTYIHIYNINNIYNIYIYNISKYKYNVFGPSKNHDISNLMVFFATKPSFIKMKHLLVQFI